MTDTRPRHTETVLGITLVCVAIAVMSGQDAILKLLEGADPRVQILFVRGTVVTLVASGTALPESGAQAWHTARIGEHLVRGVLNFAAIFLFILAIAELPLAEAIAMAAPLFTLAVSAVFLNEHIGWRRWTA